MGNLNKNEFWRITTTTAVAVAIIAKYV